MAESTSRGYEPPMQRHRLRIAVIAVAALLAAAPACAQDALSDYQAKLAQYTQARQDYDAQADTYWNAVVEKRRTRNAKRRDHVAILLADYVPTQPPIYSGPPRPINPAGPPPEERPPIPLIADFLKAASEQYGFVPQRPASELDFKRAYAQAASAAGLTRDQIVGVYAFETGGNGTYDMQAGVSARRAAAISPAVGYNQMLSTNSVSMLAEHGAQILAVLRAKAKRLNGADRAAMDRK